jgi:hypothetical protein
MTNEQARELQTGDLVRTNYRPKQFGIFMWHLVNSDLCYIKWSKGDANYMHPVNISLVTSIN